MSKETIQIRKLCNRVKYDGRNHQFHIKDDKHGKHSSTNFTNKVEYNTSIGKKLAYDSIGFNKEKMLPVNSYMF